MESKKGGSGVVCVNTTRVCLFVFYFVFYCYISGFGGCDVS